MGIRKKTAFRDYQPEIKIPAIGKPYSICPVCKNKVNVASTRCTHCGTFMGVKK